MRAHSKARVATFLAASALIVGIAVPARSADSETFYLQQGPEWTHAVRDSFYHLSQGSQLIRLDWIKALKQPDGKAFMADGLARYGFLPDSGNLPVGITVTGAAPNQSLGFTCAACHTRQLTLNGLAMRIDGGPALIDLQSFFADLDRAVGDVLKEDAGNRFDEFAGSALGHPPSPAEAAGLRKQVADWYLPYQSVMETALPKEPWGVGRLDALGMIFDNLTGTDLGTSPDRVIKENIKLANAPVRYPFLWNAPFQDHTQWPGITPNGNALFALLRNLGQAYGVFATFKPVKTARCPSGIDYLNEDSADFDGLAKLEIMIRSLQPPPWPFAVDAKLAERGATIYGVNDGEGQCAQCHGVAKPLKPWPTHLWDVGTDSLERNSISRTAVTSVLEGAKLLGVFAPLAQSDKAAKILLYASLNSIAQKHLNFCRDATLNLPHLDPQLTYQMQMVKQNPAILSAGEGNAYEARVLDGIWAAAPYLHNGSVPTLADLLTVPEKRPSSFELGAEYDIAHVGLALHQPGLHSVIKTTGCDTASLSSGNSHCGHTYGTNLSPDDKKALLEYLKIL